MKERNSLARLASDALGFALELTVEYDKYYKDKYNSNVLDEIREIAGLDSITNAQKMIESAPVIIKKGVSEAEAEKIEEKYYWLSRRHAGTELKVVLKN